jgi:hypothetical protein
VAEEKSFIELLLEEAWDIADMDLDNADMDLIERLEVYNSAHKKWLEDKARLQRAIKDRNRDQVRELKASLKDFPETLEEYEKEKEVQHAAESKTIDSPKVSTSFPSILPTFTSFFPFLVPSFVPTFFIY